MAKWFLIAMKQTSSASMWVPVDTDDLVERVAIHDDEYLKQQGAHPKAYVKERFGKRRVGVVFCDNDVNEFRVGEGKDVKTKQNNMPTNNASLTFAVGFPKQLTGDITFHVNFTAPSVTAGVVV